MFYRWKNTRITAPPIVPQMRKLDTRESGLLLQIYLSTHATFIKIVFLYKMFRIGFSIYFHFFLLRSDFQISSQVSPTDSSACTSKLYISILKCMRVVMFQVMFDSLVIPRMSEHQRLSSCFSLKFAVGFSWRARRHYLIL